VSDETKNKPDDSVEVDSEGMVEKVKNDNANDEVFTISGSMLNYAAIAIMFFIIGVAVGGVFLAEDDSIDEATLRTVLNEALADADFGGDVAAQTVNYMADDDPFLGPEDAPIVIVEFSDFLCSFCGRHFEQTLQPLLDEYGDLIRYVYRDFPGVGGDFAVMSAMGAECAHDQGRFWEYHDILFSNQQSLASEDIEGLLISFAEDLELDVATFTTCLQDQVHLNDIIVDRTDGQSAGMSGTPGFLINGRFLSGAQPFDTFAALIDNELERLGIEREGA